jgi:acyl-CoA thioesterase-2
VTGGPDPARYLATVLAIEEAGPDEYLGRFPDEEFGRSYGGQLAAQALLSSARTVRPGMRPISVHTSFLRVGAVREPITYTIERAADGRAMASRVVHAYQRGRLLSVSTAAFQDPGTEHPMLDHQATIEPAPAPESLPPRDQSMAEHFGDSITTTMNLGSWPIEVRYVDRTPWTEATSPPRNRLWMRSVVDLPDDYLIHCAVLLYAADLHLPEPILFPAELTWYELVNQVKVFGASLDYTVWFHRPFRFDDFLLHEQQSEAIANSRGLTFGRFSTRSGELVASAAESVGILIRDDR